MTDTYYQLARQIENTFGNRFRINSEDLTVLSQPQAEAELKNLRFARDLSMTPGREWMGIRQADRVLQNVRDKLLSLPVYSGFTMVEDYGKLRFSKKPKLNKTKKPKPKLNKTKKPKPKLNKTKKPKLNKTKKLS